MKILEISIQAFGTLENFKLDLSEGGQAFHALNESGKSTCLSFLRCAFYGMPRQGRNLLRNPRRRFKPFSQERSQGSVLFEHEGRQYRLMRVFGDKPAGDVTQLLDEQLGEQISLQNPDAPGEEILGLEEGAFVNTVFVGQMEVPYSSEEDKDDLLHARLAALGSSGDENVSITTIQSTLKEAERQLTSSNRKKNYLPRLEAEARDLKVALNEARVKRDDLARGMEALEEKELELQKLGTQLSEERAWARLHQLAKDEAGLRQQEVIGEQREAQEAKLRKAQAQLEARPGFRDGRALREALDAAERLRREQDGQLARWEAQGQGVPAFSQEEEAKLREQERLREKVQKRFQDNDALQNELNAQREKRQALERERSVLEDRIQKGVDERRAILSGLKDELQAAQDAERETHDRVTALEIRMRDEGFDAGQKRSKINRRYGKPYYERMRLDETYFRMLREEVRLLTQLEGAESEKVKEKNRAFASYAAERLAEFSLLPEPTAVDEAQAAKLRQYRAALGIESAEDEAVTEASVDETVSGNPEDGSASEAPAVESAPEEARGGPGGEAADLSFDLVDDASDEMYFHIEPQNLPDLNLSEISEEGQKVYRDFQASEEALAEARAGVEPAREALREAEKKYYYSQAASEIAESQVLEVQSPSQLELVGYPALAIASSVLTILSAAWMLRFDYLYLLLVGFFIALAAYGIYNVLGLVERRRLAEDAQAKRLEASRYRKELGEAADALEDARDALETLERSMDGLMSRVDKARAAWEMRETQERRAHGQLRMLRQRMNFERDAMARLDRELPELAREYQASEDKFEEEQKRQEKQRREAQEAQDAAKALVERREAAVQNFWTEQATLQDSEGNRALRERSEALLSEIQSLEEAEKTQLEARGVEREALARELREAGYADSSALDAAYAALSRKKQRLEAEARSLAEARQQLEASFGELQPGWEALLSQMKALEFLPESDVEERVRRAFEASERETAEAWIGTIRELGDELRTCHETLERALRDYERLKEVIAELSAGKVGPETLAKWRAERKRLNEELSGALTELAKVCEDSFELEIREDGSWDPGAWDHLRDELAARIAVPHPSLEALEGKERHLLQEVSSLRISLKKDGEALPSLEALTRELRATEEEIRYRNLQLAAIQLAQKGMEEADKEMQEYFSPQLQSYASSYLEKLTRGRYKRLMVRHKSKDMQLSVMDEELGLVVEGEYLSGGTYDQIYLALRLGMIKLLDPEARLPLFLDDLLLQFDGERTRAALGVLDELVREGRQVLYFTCSEALPPLIEEVCPHWEVRPLLEASAQEG